MRESFVFQSGLHCKLGNQRYPFGLAIVLTVLVTLLLTSCGGPKYKFKEIAWEPVDMGNLPSKEDYPKANAVYLLDEGEFSVEEHFIFTHHVIIKILNEAGLRYADIEIPFDEFNGVYNIRGRTILNDGTVMELDTSTIHEKSYFPEFILFADSKAKVFSMPAVEVGTVIEYTYSVVHNSPFAPTWTIQRDEPVLLSRITVDVPEFLRYNYMIGARKGVTVEKDISHPTLRTRAIFTAKNVPPINPELFMPPNAEITSKVYFSLAALTTIFGTASIEGDSWEILGKNYYRASKEKVKSDKTVSAKVKEIEEQCKGDMEIIQSLYGFVQNKIRYVAIEIERGRFLPHEPKDVFSNRYGDCKDKAFLLIVMLKEAGINAIPVLTRTTNSGTVISKFVSGQQFNHMVVGVPAEHFPEREDYNVTVIEGDKEYTISDDYILLDPTSQSTPCGAVPWYLEDTKALLVQEDGGALVTVPRSDQKDNRRVREIGVKIEDDGTIQCSVACTRTGQEANMCRAMLQHLGENEKKEWLQKKLLQDCHGAILKDFSLSGLFELSEPLTMDYSFYIPNYAQIQNASISLNPSILRNKMVDVFSRKTREHAVAFDYPMTLIDIYKIQLPKGSKLKTELEPFTRTATFGHFTFTYFEDGANLVINKQLSIKDTRISLDDYNYMRGFFQEILVAENMALHLSR
jgi:hypothetical protein